VSSFAIFPAAMKIPLVTSWWARRGRRRLRCAMRGYRHLRATGQLDSVAAAKEALTTAMLEIAPSQASQLIFGAALPSVEQAVRQYLLLHAVGLNLNEALLRSYGESGWLVTHPLPPQWRTVLRARGFPIARFRSALAWGLFVAVFLCYGIAAGWKLLLQQLAHSIRKPSGLGRYAYFHALGAGNLPRPGSDGRSHDIVSWYAQWPGRADDLGSLRHSVVGAAASSTNGVPVHSTASPFAVLSAGRLLRYAGWTIAANALAIFDALRGRWWHPLMLAEASRAALVRAQDGGLLARDYLFHNSGWIYRPLWTYEAQRKGARILFYFYSTNCESFKPPGRRALFFYGYQAMNWPNYLVWDSAQADFVRRAVGADANVNVVGPIWFQADAALMPAADARAMAVFDVTSVRASYYATLALDTEFYVPEVSKAFLDDIAKVAREYGYVLYWKRKRKMTANTHPAYRAFAESFAQRPAVRCVEPDVSAYRVIEASELVISIPFTSTALIARELGKPSCYYDPTGRMQPDDTAAHGVPLIQGRRALASWVEEHAAASKQILAVPNERRRP
jgi:polysaccharide biosynthesis PFTS motif protein